jgi:hypothetical protein
MTYEHRLRSVEEFGSSRLRQQASAGSFFRPLPENLRTEDVAIETLAELSEELRIPAGRGQ